MFFGGDRFFDLFCGDFDLFLDLFGDFDRDFLLDLRGLMELDFFFFLLLWERLRFRFFLLRERDRDLVLIYKRREKEL